MQVRIHSYIPLPKMLYIRTYYQALRRKYLHSDMYVRPSDFGYISGKPLSCSWHNQCAYIKYNQYNYILILTVRH